MRRLVISQFRPLIILRIALAGILSVPAIGWAADLETHVSVGLVAGLRTDELKWNIAGTPQGKDPDVISELTWDDLQIRQVEATATLTMEHAKLPWPQTSIRLTYGQGDIINGNNRDSDYAGDHRTQETSRTINDANDGDVLDVTVALAPHFTFSGGQWGLTPQIGYSYHEQNLTITNGTQVVPRHGSVPGLDSSYRAEWEGPWAGIAMSVIPHPDWLLALRSEWHRADYRGEGNWNLRQDLKHPRSFDHHAKGDGSVYDMQCQYQLSGGWAAVLQGHYQKWQTDAGVDRLFLANGSVLKTRLNRVTWESISLNLGLIYQF